MGLNNNFDASKVSRGNASYRQAGKLSKVINMKWTESAEPFGVIPIALIHAICGEC